MNVFGKWRACTVLILSCGLVVLAVTGATAWAKVEDIKCNGGVCAIPAHDCDLGTAPARSADCPKGTWCSRVFNSCWGLPGFKVPVKGSVNCNRCDALLH